MSFLRVSVCVFVGVGDLSLVSKSKQANFFFSLADAVVSCTHASLLLPRPIGHKALHVPTAYEHRYLLLLSLLCWCW